MLVGIAGASQWVSLKAGYGQTCAMTENGALDCWGQATSQRPYETARTPIRIESDQTFSEFTAGGAHQCAIGADRLAYCWGSNNWGQVGKPPSDP
jgi:alpha-tubulin suppressor-like RCC1 family protein